MFKRLIPGAFCALIAAATGVSGETVALLDWSDSGNVKSVQAEAAPGRAFNVAISGDVKTPSGAPAGRVLPGAPGSPRGQADASALLDKTDALPRRRDYRKKRGAGD